MRIRFRKVIVMALILTMLMGLSGFANASDSGLGYQDISQNAWYTESVEFVSALGVMNGVGADRFCPSQTVSRAMFITMLYRLAGSPEVPADEMPFTDVPMDSYYGSAVAWGFQNGIVFGVNAEKFKPHADITREQMACMAVRYAERIQAVFLSEEYHVEQYFADRGEVSAYAVEAMNLMVYRGIYRGIGDGLFCPQKTATRAEAAAVMTRLALLLEKVPAAGVLCCDGKSVSLSNADTVRLYRRLHSSAWVPAEYAEYVPYYTLTLWGTEYRFAETPSEYNGFNIVTADRTYSGMHGRNSDTILDLEIIFEILEGYFSPAL